ncbi:MAG: two-component system sensor histidine kinase NtrB [Candidatus Brocadiia bacterium]
MAPAPHASSHTGLAASDLAVAFETFSRSSQRLEEAYRALRERVRQVDHQLLQANQRLNRKVEELNSLTNYLNEILAGMDNGLVAVDAEGRVTSANRAAERILGLPAGQLLGQPYQRVHHSADGSPSPLADTLARGRATSGFEREVVCASGRRLRLSSTFAPIRDSRGALIGAVEIFADRTEFRELQKRLDRADKLAALGHMASQLAHEIRNPLNGIEGFASLLVRDLEAGSKLRQFARKIQAGARSLNRTVTHMLEFSQPCALEVRPISARAVLEEALSFVEEECRHQGLRGVAFRRDFSPRADRLVADPDQLRQAAMNLLLNAVQALGEGGGEVRLATRACGQPPDRVQIRIQDTGPGIPDEVRSKIFDPFFTTKSTGSGLGLAIVRRIARLHGGSLELDSEDGQGTTAVLTLPRQAPRPRPTMEPR